MNIWVDADACPGVVKDIVFRAAERSRTQTILVANRFLRIPPSAFVRAVQVPQGFDVADQYIAEQTQAGDLVITADLPLAAEVIEKGAIALNPRGELYGPQNIRELLNMRDFMDTMRASGVQTGGPPPFNHADRQAFANQLDRLLAERN